MKCKDSIIVSGGKFSWAGEYKVERVERHPERLTLGHAKLRCGNAELERESDQIPAEEIEFQKSRVEV